MYITQDSSWYSAARNQTNAIVGLIDASRPPSTPTGDIQTAALTNFSNATSPYTMGSFNVMKQSAYTSDTNGDFELNKKPGITTSNYNVYMTALSLVLRNAKNITYTLSGGELDSSIVKTIDVSGSEIISISNNSAFTNIEIKIDSTVTPQTEVILQGVFFWRGTAN